MLLRYGFMRDDNAEAFSTLSYGNLTDSVVMGADAEYRLDLLASPYWAGTVRKSFKLDYAI